jgi:antitoxin (DNA-binding transcriptional repressor) of toxin-antitoxin stability system
MNWVDLEDLQEHLALYLQRVASGEKLEIFENGKPVALLSPPESGGALDRLAGKGMIQSFARHDLLELGPPPSSLRVEGRSASEALAQMRATEE